MSIVIIIPYGIEQSGIFIFIERLATSFEILGVNVHMVIIGGGPNLLDMYFAFSGMDDVIAWLNLRVTQYDIVFWAGVPIKSVDIRMQIEVSFYLRTHLKKCVFFMWERTGETEVISEPALQQLLFLEACDAILVLNDEQEQYLNQNGLPLNKRFRLTPGVNTNQEFVPVSRSEKKRCRKSLGFPLDSTLVLSVARFTARKRPRFLLETWLSSSILREKATLILYGSSFGNLITENQISDLASQQSNILIIRHDNAMNRVTLYQSADFFVSASLSEGEPSTLSESMACGLPVIASNIPGHKIVNNGVTGILFESTDQQDFQFAMEWMVENVAARIRMGRMARDFAVTKRDIMVIAKSFLAFAVRKLAED